MRIALIGGTGFLGPDVVTRLSMRGADVLIFHRGATEAELPASVRHVHGDRSDLARFAVELRRFAPDVAVDMRAMTEADAAAFVEAFAGVAERSVVISSSDVYRAYGRLGGTEPGPPDPIPLHESAPLRERLFADRDARPHDRTGSLADYDKILVERVARSDPRLAATVLRLGFVHGPRSYRHYQFLKRMDDGRDTIIVDERFARWHGTHAYSENVADAVVSACLDPTAAGQTYNVGEPEPLDMGDLIAALGIAAGWRGRVLAVGAERLPEGWRSALGLDQEFVLDTRKIRRELGYRETVSPSEGLARTVTWMRHHPPTPNDPMGKLELDYTEEDRIIAAVT